MSHKDEHSADDKVRKYAEAVAQALIGGRPRDQVIDEMVRQGWPPADARDFVGKIEYAQRQAQRLREEQASLKSHYLIHMVLGVIWLALGVLAIVASSDQHDRTGLGIAIGAFGACQFGWAIINWRRSRKG